MALRDNLRLYDILTRKQIYVEGVKANQSREFDKVLAELQIELKRLLGRIKYRTLDGLTKVELNAFMSALRSAQARVYSRYTDDLLEQLQAFMRADLTVSRRLFASVLLNMDEAPSDEDSIALIEAESERSGATPLFGLAAVTGASAALWSRIVNAPIPANGIYPLAFVKAFSTSAQAAVENTIRQGYANGWTVEETLTALIGDAAIRQGTSGQLQRIAVQHAAVTATVTQHVTGMVTAGVASAIFGRYQWHSVIDDATTDICRGRNRKIYRFGEGPIPPAHIRCRSIIVPLIVGSKDDLPDESFYTWAQRQPEAFASDIFDAETYKALKRGELKAKELNKYRVNKPLTIDEYESKINEILSR